MDAVFVIIVYGKKKYQWSLCVWSQITLPLSLSMCCARDVGADRSGWKMWSLLLSSSFYSSSPTTSLKIAGRKRRQWSRGSICWAASGFNTPTTSKREKSPLNHTFFMLILISTSAWYYVFANRLLWISTIWINLAFQRLLFWSSDTKILIHSYTKFSRIKPWNVHDTLHWSPDLWQLHVFHLLKTESP